MAKRINARIDDDLASKLEDLGRRTGQSTSAIIKEALEAYHARVRSTPTSPARALRASGLVGCASGPRELSTRYKDELARSWSKKA